MHYCYWAMRDCVSRFQHLYKTIDHETKRQAGVSNPDDLEVVVAEGYDALLPRMNAILMDLSNAVSEAATFDSGYNSIFRFMKRTIFTFLQQANEKKLTIREIRQNLDDIRDSLADFHYDSEYDGDAPIKYREKYMYKRLKLNSLLLQNILDRIHIPIKREINTLVPLFFDELSHDKTVITIAESIRELADQDQESKKNYFKSKIYVNPIKAEYVSRVSRDLYNRVAIGDTSTISNESFDLLVLNSDITTKVSSSNFGIVVRKELITVRDYMKYLRVGGWIVMTIPYYRINSMCSFLSKNLSNIRVFKEMDSPSTMFSEAGEVFIVGRRKPSSLRELDEDSYNYLRGIYSDTVLEDAKFNLNDDMNKEFIMEMPREEREIKIFRTGILDEKQIKAEGTSKEHFKEFFNRQKSGRAEFNSRQPLLPFNIGQIGLILTSGCLDGIVEEEGNACHLIKGRILKKTELDRSITGSIATETSVVSNHVEINIILPDGTRKTLA